MSSLVSSPEPSSAMTISSGRMVCLNMLFMDCSKALGQLYVETNMLTLQSNSPACYAKLTVFGNDGVVAGNGNLNGNIGEAVYQRVAYNCKSRFVLLADGFLGL